MSFFSNHAPYLMQCGTGRLTFRIRIPADIRECLGKREYRRSLGYQSLSGAKAQALRLAVAAHEVFEFARAYLASRHDSPTHAHAHAPACTAAAPASTIPASGDSLTSDHGKRYTRTAIKQEKSKVSQGNPDGQLEVTIAASVAEGVPESLSWTEA